MEEREGGGSHRDENANRERENSKRSKDCRNDTPEDLRISFQVRSSVQEALQQSF